MSSQGARFRSNNRLTSPEQYRRAFSTGRRSADKRFLFLVVDNGSRHARLGLAIPKKHVQSAVKRNRIKRVIRESFRLNSSRLAGKDIVVLLRGPVTGLGRIEFDSIFNKHWKKISQCNLS